VSAHKARARGYSELTRPDIPAGIRFRNQNARAPRKLQERRMDREAANDSSPDRSDPGCACAVAVTGKLETHDGMTGCVHPADLTPVVSLPMI
jgi:hypothetical protein